MLTSVDTFNKAVTYLSASDEFTTDTVNKAGKRFICIRPNL